MAKKYGTKLAESLKKGARSSVGRAPQWHRAALEKSNTPTTLLQIPANAEVVVIPDGWTPVTAMRMRKGIPDLFRVLVRKTSKRLENDLNGKRRRKTA